VFRRYASEDCRHHAIIDIIFKDKIKIIIIVDTEIIKSQTSTYATVRHHFQSSQDDFEDNKDRKYEYNEDVDGQSILGYYPNYYYERLLSFIVGSSSPVPSATTVLFSLPTYLSEIKYVFIF